VCVCECVCVELHIDIKLFLVIYLFANCFVLPSCLRKTKVLRSFFVFYEHFF